MKKQYSLRHKYRNGNPLAGTPVVAFGIVLGIAALFLVLRLIFPAAIIAFAEPFWRGGASLEAAVGGATAGVGNAATLAKENTQLAAQVASLQNQNAVLTARSQDLTKLLGGTSTLGTAGQGIAAGVLARPPLSPYDTLIVAIGAKDGVVVGATVTASGGIPIGTVQSTTAHTATITLLSMAGHTTDAWVGESRMPLTLVGKGAGAFTATLPKASAVNVGDNVYVSGPGAIPVGTISQVETDPSSPSVVLSIQPFVNIFSTTWVEITR